MLDLQSTLHHYINDKYDKLVETKKRTEEITYSFIMTPGHFFLHLLASLTGLHMRTHNHQFLWIYTFFLLGSISSFAFSLPPPLPPPMYFLCGFNPTTSFTSVMTETNNWHLEASFNTTAVCQIFFF